MWRLDKHLKWRIRMGTLEEVPERVNGMESPRQVCTWQCLRPCSNKMDETDLRYWNETWGSGLPGCVSRVFVIPEIINYREKIEHWPWVLCSASWTGKKRLALDHSFRGFGWPCCCMLQEGSTYDRERMVEQAACLWLWSRERRESQSPFQVMPPMT